MSEQIENNKNLETSDHGFKKPEVPSLTSEQREEAKLRAKYPNVKAGAGGSALLKNRLHTNKPKYFDSGDYNMAKSVLAKKVPPPSEKLLLTESTGEAIPTPENLPTRKPSLIQSKLASLS